MTDPRWTAEHDVLTLYRRTGERVEIERHNIDGITDDDYDKLVEYIDTLTRARELITQIARVPFGDYVAWRQNGNSESADVLSQFEHDHKALLDLLTGEAL